jgi:hypothetical protein
MDLELDHEFLRSGNLLGHELSETEKDGLVENNEQQNGNGQPTEKVSQPSDSFPFRRHQTKQLKFWGCSPTNNLGEPL